MSENKDMKVFYKHSLANFTQQALMKGIELTEQQIQQLIEYQFQVCSKLDWIELGHDRLEMICTDFLQSPYLTSNNITRVLKSAILYYYQLRSNLDWHTSDYTLCNVIFEIANEHFLLIDSSCFTAMLKKVRDCQ